MVKKYVLQEFLNLDYSDDLLTEDEREGNRQGTHLIVAGKIQSAGKKNGNGRIYPRPVLQREVQSYQNAINERRALGELDHPDDSVVNLKNVSHLVTKMWWDGDNVMGKIQVLNTPSGNVLKSLAEANVKLGISSRGMGSVREGMEGTLTVEDDFQLICFDMVSEPSTPGAYMSKPGGLQENQIIRELTKVDRINYALNDILKGVV